MGNRNYILLITFFLSLTAHGQQYQLIWSDEFNENTLNESYWNYELGNGNGGWGTGQLDYCTKDNVVLSNGTLKLVLKKEDVAPGFHYSSGRINTQNKKYFKYGKIEARCKIPAGFGVGAAFWMLPQFNNYGGWPKSGEIDILETNGNTLFTNYGTVHFMQWDIHQFKGNHAYCDSNLSTTWHDYTILWDENSIKWLLDGEQYHEFVLTNGIDGRKPFNEEFYIIISAGIGSNFSGKKIDDKLLPQNFEIDYVRCYKELTQPTITSAATSPSGDKILLKFSEEMNLNNSNPNNFKVLTDNNSEYKVASIAKSYRIDDQIELSLSSPVAANDILKLSYNGNKITSKYNQPIPEYQNLTIHNLIFSAPPTIVSAICNEDPFAIEISFTHDIDTASIKSDLIDIKKNGNHMSFLVSPTNRPKVVRIELTEAILKGDSINIALQPQAIKSMTNVGNRRTDDIPITYSLPAIPLAPVKIEAENYNDQYGVLTEDCKDTLGGKNVGYIDPKDWMSYFVNVDTNGHYQINLRTSSDKSMSMMKLFIDGKFHEMVFTPFTGDWQKWKSHKSQPIELKKGVHTIKIECSGGGYNVNWLEVLKAD